MKEKLLKLRRKLHQNAELAGRELNSSKIIRVELEALTPDELFHNLGGYGILAVFKGNRPGKTIMFRADMDAVPIKESSWEYNSFNPEVSHKCGHDGHSTILLGLANKLQNRNFKGIIYLLFQPAEESGKGAQAVLQEEMFKNLSIDYCVGIHNLPSFEQNVIVTKSKTFASASSGMKLILLGKSSHASQPERGNSPVLAFTAIIEALHALPKLSSKFEDAAMITIVHACLGLEAFGTNPAEAVIMATLRSHHTKDLVKLQNRVETLCSNIAQAYELDCVISWVEEFPAVCNDDELAQLILECAPINKRSFLNLETPFAWSEDFAHFGKKFPSALVGIGAGLNQPPLHSTEYDFPDEIILPTIDFLFDLSLFLNN